MVKRQICLQLLRKRKSEDSTAIKTWVNEEILKTKFTILLISKETFNRKYVSYEIQKSKENKNTFIPILIDNESNKFTNCKLII